MSRLLMNWLLMQSGYPPAVIEVGERHRYLAALAQADGGACDPFIALMAEHVLESLELSIKAAQGQPIG